MNEAIGLESLAMERDGGTVLDSVSMTVAPATWFGLIGANGSGKTTLLRGIAGRLPIARGICRLHGADLSRSREERARLTGFMPPIETLPERLSATDLFEILCGDHATASGNIGDLAAALDLDALRHRPIGQCSAGMRQRIAIALAFAGGQPIVVLDEPFNWLDPVAAYDVRAALREKVRTGLTLVTALHDLTTLTAACDAAALLRAGRVQERYSVTDLREAARSPLEFERRMIAGLRCR